MKAATKKAAAPARPAGQPPLIELRKIRLDMGTQSRAALQPEGVQDYAELLEGGYEMPPVVVYPLGGGRYVLASGFHRWHAYRRAGRSHIPATVRQGDVHAARLFSAGCNLRNGLRRTGEDKRAAVALVLGDESLFVAHFNRNNSAIARHCGTTDFLVRAMREEREEADAAGGNLNLLDPGPPHRLPAGSDEETVGRRQRQAPRTALKLVRQCSELAEDYARLAHEHVAAAVGRFREERRRH